MQVGCELRGFTSLAQTLASRLTHGCEGQGAERMGKETKAREEEGFVFKRGVESQKKKINKWGEINEGRGKSSGIKEGNLEKQGLC